LLTCQWHAIHGWPTARAVDGTGREELTEQPADAAEATAGGAFAAPFEPPQQPQAQPQPLTPVEQFLAASGGVPPARPRRTRTIMVCLVTLAAGFGAGLATGRATAPKAGTGNPAAISAPAGSTAAAATSASAAPAITGKTLVDALIPLPPGAARKTVPHAGADGSMTLDQFLQELYPDSTDERGFLEARGFVGAAATWFDTANGQELSFYLISFSSQGGAHSEALGLVNAHQEDPDDSSEAKFAVPALTDGTGFETSALDSYGNTGSYVYGAVGDVAVIVHCYTPAKLDRADLLTLVDQQAARLSAH